MPFQNIYGLWGPSLIVLEKNEDKHTYCTDRQTDTPNLYRERFKFESEFKMPFLVLLVKYANKEVVK